MHIDQDKLYSLEAFLDESGYLPCLEEAKIRLRSLKACAKEPNQPNKELLDLLIAILKRGIADGMFPRYQDKLQPTQ